VEFLLPYVRLELLIHTMRTRTWAPEAWPLVKHELIRALKLRRARTAGSELSQPEGRLERICRLQWRAGVVAIPFLTACVTAAPHSGGPYIRLDNDTEYSIEERPVGFRVSVKHSRYQFFPDAAEVRHSCRTTVSSLAHDIAAKRGRRIRPLTEDRIRVDTARNILNGVSSCSASATVEYE
jgi:hypothetical protein